MSNREKGKIMSLFHPLSLREIFVRVAELFLQRWGVFMVTSGMVYVLGWCFAYLTSLFLGNDLVIDGFKVQPFDRDLVTDGSFRVWVFLVWEQLCYFVFLAVSHGANAYVVAELYLDRYPPIQQALEKAFDRLGSLLGSLVLIIAVAVLPLPLFLLTVFTTGGDVGFFIVVGAAYYSYCMFITVIMYHVYPVTMIENSGPFASIRRSWTLTDGHRWHILGVLLLWGFIKAALGMLTQWVIEKGQVLGSDSIFYVGTVLDMLLATTFASLNSMYVSHFARLDQTHWITPLTFLLQI